MICTYLRSSSINSHDWCEHQYALNYVLGIKTSVGISADKGSVVHKALELLALVKLTQQKKKKSFKDDHFGRIYIDKHESCSPQRFLEMSYKYFQDNTNHIWQPKDFKDCQRWFDEALTFKNGLFDPRNRTILKAEKQFDFEIDQPWAHYNYSLPDGKRLQGKLALKGTIDLITELEPGVIEVVDWKTGSRINWGSGEKKDELSLLHDPQTLVYFYAVSHLYPKVNQIFITFFFLEQYQFRENNNGGPFTVSFTRKDIPLAEDMIKSKFLKIKSTNVPKLNITWRCSKICFFGKTSHPKDLSKTYCEYFRNKIAREGMDKVIAEDANLKDISEYGDSAGRRKNLGIS